MNCGYADMFDFFSLLPRFAYIMNSIKKDNISNEISIKIKEVL